MIAVHASRKAAPCVLEAEGSTRTLAGRSQSHQSPLTLAGMASGTEERPSTQEQLCLRRVSSVPVHDKCLKAVVQSSRPPFRIQMPAFEFVGDSLFGGINPKTQPPFLENGTTTYNQTLNCSCTTVHPSPLQPPTPPDETSIRLDPMANQSSSEVVDTVGERGVSASGEGMEAKNVEGRIEEPAGDLTGGEGDDQDSTWIDETVKIALSEVAEGMGPGTAVRVVALSLPSPVAEAAGVSLTTAFPALITGLQTKLQAFQSQYIQITHAVPPGFSLNSLPTSPPGTPMGGSGQQDYFTLGNSVFSSAFALVDRHDKHTPGLRQPIPTSPCLAAPPFSIDFSLMERYIPPSTVEELADLFNPHGTSNFVDRLLELSSKNGTILFIYPTKTGAETFTSKYLGPILDPLLRNIISSRHLSADIGVSVGKMVAAGHLLSFANMSRKLTILLHELSRTAQPIKSTYSVVYSTKQRVKIEKSVWLEWFVRQERPRIRQVITEYFNRAKMLPGDEHVNYAVLTREIMEGMAKREYEDGPPKDGVEVGVFVVRRST